MPASSQTGQDASHAGFATSYSGVVAFLAVVAEGTFAKAGDRLGVGRSAVSRSVQRLEDQLGSRLFFRTTRSTTLTREGQLFYESCHPGVERITQAMEEMRDLRDGPPRGRLRVASTVGFGRKVIAPLLGDFRAAYPQVAVDLILDDGIIDFTTDHIDVAFRNGRMEDGQIIAKQLLPMQLMICASAEYARAHGVPRTVEEIGQHRCIDFRRSTGRVHEWELKVNGHLQKLTPASVMSFNDADLVLQAVLEGNGLAQMAGYQVAGLVESGDLVPCLPQYSPDDRAHWICYQSRQQMPSRMRVFIDHMTSRVRALNVASITTFSARKKRVQHDSSSR